VQRVTGDQYDHFNVQFAYPNGGINDTMCRQIDGCATEVSDLVLGQRDLRIAKTRSLTLPARWSGNIRNKGRIRERPNSIPTIKSTWILSTPFAPTSP